MAERTDSTALRITNQFRSKTGFVYELKADGVRLTVDISARQGAADPAEWHIAARSGAPPAASIDAWGPTRLETLRDVARQWSESTLALNLPRFDWDAVAKALADVRAV